MREQYTQPVICITLLTAEDVIATSSGVGDDQNDSIYRVKEALGAWNANN